MSEIQRGREERGPFVGYPKELIEHCRAVVDVFQGKDTDFTVSLGNLPPSRRKDM
jgi:hypothetical protein